MKRIIIISLTILAFFVVEDAEAQCAMCKASATSAQESGNSAANGLNSGILYLMAIPYLLLLFFFRNHIKNLFKEVTALYKKA